MGFHQFSRLVTFPPQLRRMGDAHNPGVFKKPAKSHKPFKGHRTKGQIKAVNRGRVSAKELSQKRSRSISKAERKNIRSQQIAQRRREQYEKRRNEKAVPVLITLLSLDENIRAEEVIEGLFKADEANSKESTSQITYLNVPRFKGRLSFACPPTSNTDDVLDFVKTSDVVCFVWPLSGQLTQSQLTLVTSIKAQGMPSIVNILPGLTAIQSGKKREEARSSVMKTINQLSLDSERIFPTGSSNDAILLLRTFIEMRKKHTMLQMRRAHVLVEKVDLSKEEAGLCTLSASGYIRGPALTASGLLHIVGFGDFQIEKIEEHPDPHPLQNRKNQENSEFLQITRTALPDPEKQESLQSEIVPDPMNAEQTWPDEQEITDADKLHSPAEKKRVPKGTSAYQAAWILESDEENEDGEEASEDESDEDDEEMSSGNSEGESDENEGEDESEGRRKVTFETEESTMGDEENGGMDEDTDMDDLQKFRAERDDQKWPDQIDTPMDLPARIRFQKYRGLKSFRTSPWNPAENLPYEYARIFKFHNFKKTKKTVLKELDERCAAEVDTVIVESGKYVTIHLRNVPANIRNEWSATSPLILYQPLAHEQKMSVINLVIRKNPNYTLPIVSKEKLIFHVGFRKFEAEPVFSQHTNGDKFKMERFMPIGSSCVASIFAPITFPPATVLVYKFDGKRKSLVATGSVLDNNPDRVVLKRLVLSGHPFKINKRSVVARYMFFNIEDIEWFKPVELYTPSGRRGHITESVGTHGHMKCRFDQQISAQDQVMMSLYKRVFPKWTFNPKVSCTLNQISGVGKEDEEMAE
ncbi:hypothetical protein WR25_25488 [Diploscapter pachys]|uniref:Pre-rRNA-processing protein TSR1 homolog n=1 Tax=Diploscapter pachys TaxID=2018661 RepID=A0A2A2KMS6_9BILA|nr:hypothetical protein WR25_25488 [Diploscapter pachys]